MSRDAANDNVIDRTRTLWQRRLGREISREDARQIAVNMMGFFSLMAEWSKAERRTPANDDDMPPKPQRGVQEHD